MHVGFFRTCMEIQSRCAELGIEYDFLITEGESLITRARNNILATFMNTGLSTLAMIDSDIEMSADDFMKLYSLSGVRGAAVNMKRPDFAECLSCFKDGKQIKRVDMPDHPFPVDYLGTAVLFVDRTNIETLYKAYPEQHYTDPIVGPAVALFETAVVNDLYLSEDFGFCELCREQGMEILCEPSIQVKHYGSACWSA